jgi:hypothetical protein
VFRRYQSQPVDRVCTPYCVVSGHIITDRIVRVRAPNSGATFVTVGLPQPRLGGPPAAIQTDDPCVVNFASGPTGCGLRTSDFAAVRR